jgi:glycosyltransferase involved in cell wall biosynthesis
LSVRSFVDLVAGFRNRARRFLARLGLTQTALRAEISLTGESWRATDPDGSTWSELLCDDPLIFHAWPSIGFPLGSASVVGPLVRDRAAHILLGFAWTMEPPEHHRPLIATARSYLAAHPRHEITFTCNTDAETSIFAHAGFSAITLSHNLLVDDALFHPMPGVIPVYDAVSNARLSPDKRVELAASIERVAFVYFYDGFGGTPARFHAEHARLRALMPGGVFVNKLTPEGCEWLLPHEVNRVYAESRVGLCLSPIEGAMRASIEYLFAGLSVVSTPSLGGRDLYFDDEYCTIAEPDPRAILAAVDELIARNVPRDYVRTKTLKRIDADRARYIELVQSLMDRAGRTEPFADRFCTLTRTTNIQRWRSMVEFSETVLKSLEAKA